MIGFVICLLSLPFCLIAKPLDVQVSAAHAILINAQTGAVLFEKKADEPAYPASTTKIGLALCLLEHYSDRLEEIVTVKKEALASITPQAKKESNYRSPPHWLESDGTHMALIAGEELKAKDLLRGVLMVSANDACNALALHFGGSIPKFVDQTNEVVKKIGCQNTHFMNPHGFHHPQHVTTARDLGRMAQQGLKDPLFREIVGTARYKCPASNLSEERVLQQTNLLLRKGDYFDPRVVGVKTGITKVAGYALVAAAKVGERELISVVLGCPCRADALKDTKQLFDVAFSEPLMRKHILSVDSQGLTRKIKGARGKLKAKLLADLNYDFYPAEKEEIKAIIQWNIPKLPIKQGQEVGHACILNEQGVIFQQVAIVCSANLKRSAWILLVIIPLGCVICFWLAKQARAI